MIKRLLKFAVLKIKGRSIVFDDAVRNTDLLSLVFRNTLSALRGFIKLRQLVLLGKSVTLRSKYNMQLEKGVTIGDYSTLEALSLNGLRIGASSSIGSFSILKVSGTLTSIGNKIEIGQNVGIGDFAHIGGAGGVVIGNDTIAGAYLSLHPENHVFTDKQQLIREQGVTRKGIIIGSNCWIGAKVTVLDGSQVGNGCVIAAGAVVNGIFPDNVVIGGVPAKILKER
jgi:acetyltransferase-like isoleucine patch superfamily enzyme